MNSFQVYVDGDQVVVKADRLHMKDFHFVGCTTLCFPMEWRKNLQFPVFASIRERIISRFNVSVDEAFTLSHTVTDIISPKLNAVIFDRVISLDT